MRARVPIFVSLVATLLSGCGAAGRRPADALANVVLISIDTLRPDHLGTYGYSRPTSPAVDALTMDGVLFENTFAPAPSTLPSHASLFTSLLPQHHRASHKLGQAIPEAATTLAETLVRHGYRAASFNGGGQIAAVYGFDRGFEVYRSFERQRDRFAAVALQAEDWLRSRPPEPFFLFLHSYEVHQPFSPSREVLEDVAGSSAAITERLDLGVVNAGPFRFSESELQHAVDLYDAEVRSMDRGIEQLVDFLREAGLYDSALVVFTADHGEELGERGFLATHAHTLHEELLRVPLILKLPGGEHAGRRIDALARLIDVAPTVLDLLGLPAPTTFSGRSLRSLLSSPTTDGERIAVAYRDTATLHPESSIHSGRWKLIADRLYDLQTDPGETRDLAAQRSEAAARLRRLLAGELGRSPFFETRTVVPDPATARRLEALGYLD